MSPDRRVRAKWRQETIHRVVEARPTQRATDGSGRALAYRVRLADGSTMALDAEVVCERLSNEHGERILLTVDRAAHVLARHKQRNGTGVFARGVTLTRLLGLFRRHHRESLGSGRDSHKIEVSCDRVVGTGGVASVRELAGRGVLSDDDLERLAQLKEETFAANVRYAAADRAAFVERVNADWRDRNVRFRERNGVVLPAFIAEPQPTRSFVVVLDRPRLPGRLPDDEKRIRTVYPGELLCDSPAHARYMPLMSVSDLPAGTTITELQRRHDDGELLGERERTVLRAFRQAFEVWYEHGALLPPWLVPRRGPRQRPRERPLTVGTALRQT